MKALIVDDERLARAELTRLLRAHPAIEIVGEAASVAEARARLDALAPALVFLDVEMPGGSGFDLLTELDAVPQVIFTTAYDAHAVRAFEVNALDYVLKPIEPSRLAAAIAKALALEARRRDPGPAPAAASLERVFVRDGDRCWFVHLDEVPLLESEGNYARLHLAGEQPLLGRSLSYLEARLDPARFFRASRQYLVNLRHVERVELGPGGTLVLVLRGGREIEMSRRQSQLFRERMSL